MTVHFPLVPGIEQARQQSKKGPPLPPGRCLGTVAQFLLGHPSGQDTASIAWSNSKHRHHFHPGDSLDDFLRGMPRGFPLWFVGGSPTENHPEGDGHVVITAVPFLCWSEDRKRSGFYDRVTIKSILTWNRTHPLRLVGWSEDIAGFMVPYKPHSKDPYRVKSKG